MFSLYRGKLGWRPGGMRGWCESRGNTKEQREMEKMRAWCCLYWLLVSLTVWTGWKQNAAERTSCTLSVFLQFSKYLPLLLYLPFLPLLLPNVDSLRAKVKQSWAQCLFLLIHACHYLPLKLQMSFFNICILYASKATWKATCQLRRLITGQGEEKVGVVGRRDTTGGSF